MDGLQGIHTWKLLGYFRFDLYGYTAYSYALAVLFVLFLFARRLIHSPFGLSLRGIRENYVRMPAIGAPSQAHLRTIYTIAACIAGIAGALLAQTTETVSLDSLGFERSAEVVVMLVLGGAGRLYGGLVGAIIFMVARDQFSGIEPQYWYFWIGILLVARRDVSSQRHSRRPGEAHRRAGAGREFAGACDAAASPRVSARWSSPAISRSNCRKACVMR